MTSAEIESLRQFIGAYFHQDFFLDVASPDENVQCFITDVGSPSRVKEMAGLIEKLVDETPDDAALEQIFFDELGSEYIPTADGRSVREWLRHVATMLRNAESSRPSEGGRQ
jgi:hypothetical protein